MRGSALPGYGPAVSSLLDTRKPVRLDLAREFKPISCSSVLRNVPLSELELVEKRVTGVAVAQSGALCIETGEFTGRSPNDRFWVAREPSFSAIDWESESNRPLSPESFDSVMEGCLDYTQEQDRVCVFDGFFGSAASPMKVRVVAAGPMSPVQLHFATNMFITFEQAGITDPGLDRFHPDITILACSDFRVPKWQLLGLNSSACVSFDFERSIGLIAGTKYNGELKKLAFSVANFYLPLSGKLSMHCSATRPVDYQGPHGQTSAILFGLSGTGKTTLGSDPMRAMIGDDEHVWDDRAAGGGIHNIEGGCYAKVVGLKKESEPVIYSAANQKGSIFENVVLGPDGTPDFNDTTLTENGRVAYDLSKVPDHVPHTVMNPAPSVVMFLACDSFGVLPPISRLSTGAAMYHFMSGFSAKVAGTERGVTEPTPTFSPMFGGAFMPLPATTYANLLRERLEADPSITVWLLNTGWTGGPPGTGQRFSIDTTRAIVSACLSGALQNVDYVSNDIFNLNVPTECPGVQSKLLDPRKTWENEESYFAAAKKLAGMFRDNWKAKKNPQDLAKFGPSEQQD